ncbi:MAG: hypothetical protein ACXVA2_15880 [Mucilaginibacter sp.]
MSLGKVSLIIIYFGTSANAKLPDWTHENSFVRSGNNLKIVCQGQGPSLGLARKSALANCRTTAAEFLTGSFRTQSVSIETERSISFHQEVGSENEVSGLVCAPMKEFSEEVDGLISIYILCDFDLKKVSAKLTFESKENLKILGSKTGVVSDKENLAKVPKYKIETPENKIQQDDNYALIVTVLPQNCSDILVEGDRPRSIKCETPTTVVVGPNDKTLIVRADGFKTKHITIDTRKPIGTNALERIEVLLER